jgi:hypothetical protein
MNIYILTQEQFNKTNKALSEYFGVEYTYIDVGDQEIEYERNGRGGKTKGTTGFKYTEEQRKSMSVSRKGKPNGLLGKKLSEEHKQRISQSKRGSKWSEETRKKMTESRKNQKHTEETKQKMKEIALEREKNKRLSKLKL